MTAFDRDCEDTLSWISEELVSLEQSGLRRDRISVHPLPDGRCEVYGQILVNFATNDYLGLAGHPEVVEQAKLAMKDCGTGSRASALLTGRTPWHDRLERRIAEFEGTEAALLFSSGYAANIGVIGALVGAGDVVIGDRLNHASLIDGCRLSGATFRVYSHCDVDQLDHELRKHRDKRRRLIVTDGLFSMDGDLAPLPELCDVAERHQAMLLVDEAHGTGVFGKHGRGACEHFGVENRVSIRIGTLSKALGSQGAFVAGSRKLIDWLYHRARSQVYSTSLTPAACAAALASLDVVDAEPQRRKDLKANADFVRSKLVGCGVPESLSVVGPIIPLVIGDADEAVKLSKRLRADGLLVPAIRPPSVPQGTSRLRISVSSVHREEDLQRLVEAIKILWKQ